MLARALAFTCLTLLSSLSAFGQGESAPKFEVADVHLSPPTTNVDDTDMSGGLMRDGRYHLRRATMLNLVSLAYGVDQKKVLGGPNWLDLDRFDIRAKVPAGATAATVKPMLRTLLAERFRLVVHNDTKPVPAWVLSATKHPLLKHSDGSGDGGCHGSHTENSITLACRNMTMAAFVAGMGDMNGAWYYIGDNLVSNQTGLEGAWDFDLKYSQRWNTTTAGTEIVSLFDAIEKLGLKLEPSSVPEPVVVVDSVNRTPSPNSPDIDKVLPPPPTEFEVAEVKPTDPDYHGLDFQATKGGRIDVRGANLKWLIAEVWGLQEEMIVNAPKFAESDRWDIIAKAPNVMVADNDADIDADSLFAMVRKLLADRFKLTIHTEERPMDAYTMTALKPKLKPADPASRIGCHEGPATLTKMDARASNPVLGRLLTCTNVTMSYLADQLQFLANGYVHTAVLDATGLDGGWDFTLSFSKRGQFQGNDVPTPGASAASDPNGALSLSMAMEKQLGLKLELKKRPVPVLVIDHLEQKPTDN